MMSGAFATGIGYSELTALQWIANQRRNCEHRQHRSATEEGERPARRSHSSTGWSVTQNYCTEICVQWGKEEAPPHSSRQEATFRDDEEAMGNWSLEGAEEESFQAHYVCGGTSKDF
jgi:hypothetical protein